MQLTAVDSGMGVSPVRAAADVAPLDWVPVEDRWLGMDRRALVPAVVVAAFAALAFWGFPALNGAIAVDDPVRAGDVIQLDEAVTFAPAAGWNLTTGLRQGDAATTGYPGTAQVTQNGVAFTVIADTFDGTPRALLSQIKRTNSQLDADSAITVNGRVQTFTTVSGEHGVIAPFTSSSGVGLVAAFVFGGTGVEVVAFGPTTIDSSTQRDIISMLESVQPLSPADGTAS